MTRQQRLDAFLGGLQRPAADDWLEQLPLEVDLPELGKALQRHDPDMAWQEDYAPHRTGFACLHCGEIFDGPRARPRIQAHVIRLCRKPAPHGTETYDDPPF